MKSFLLNRKTPQLDHQELTKSSFWVGQFFVVAATIIGVYLAASEGLNQALKFDYLSSQTDNYHLQSALLDEYKDNLTTIEQFEQLLTGGSHYNRQTDNLILDLFIWDTMKFSRATMETPSSILTGVRRTYHQASDIAKQLKMTKIGQSIAVEQLKAVRQRGSNDVLPEIKRSLLSIQTTLTDAGVKL